MKKLHIKGRISTRYILPFSILMVIQMVLVILTVYYGETFNQINTKSVENFESKVNLRSNYLQTTMLDTWGNLNSDYETINSKISSQLVLNHYEITDLYNDKELSKECLSEIADELYLMIRKNMVTESFIIFNEEVDSNGLGIYLRDLNPSMANANDNDILIEVAPVGIKNNYLNKGFDISTQYSTEYTSFFDLDAYKKPTAVVKNNNIGYKSYGYWSDTFEFHATDAISYTMPLVLNGEVYGVLGVGISKVYLKQQLLRITSQDGNLENVAIAKITQNDHNLISFDYRDSLLMQYNLWDISNTKYNGIYRLNENDSFYVCSSDITIYGNNSPYEGESWIVFGLMNENVLFSGNSDVVIQIIYAAVLSTVIVLLIELLIGIIVTKPIRTLTLDLEKNGIKNRKTNIYEIDLLLNEIQKYETKVYELPSKMSEIIGQAGINIASFEYNQHSNLVTVSPRFYKILDKETGGNTLDLDEYKKILGPIGKTNDLLLKDDEVFYQESNNTWIKFKIVTTETGFIGVLLDVTKDVFDKQRIEEERDKDFLTGLYNRRGFNTKVAEIFGPSMKEALLMMIDLDNLKQVNDNYGHDAGDEYIKALARMISTMSKDRMICSHLSGDEFLVLLYHFDTKDEIYEIVNNFKERVLKNHVNILGKNVNLRFSCGMSFMDNHQSITELKKEADFAMYEVKSKHKNDFNFFNKSRFNKTATELELKDKLLYLLDNNMIIYSFQPIVSIKSAEVVGYEALMRTPIFEFKTPSTILEIAKKYNFLSKIECTTFSKSLEQYDKAKCDKKLFINSIASEVMDDGFAKELYSKYKHLFPQIIVEITEEESIDIEKMNIKLEYMNITNSTFAIDDYGTGYNNILSIMKYSPLYVKINADFIKDIDKDIRRQNLVRPLVDYCHHEEILVIAECIETEDELRTVIELGFDYVQGFFIGYPDPIVKDISPEIKNFIKKYNKNK